MSIIASRPGDFAGSTNGTAVYHSYRKCAKCGKGFVGKTNSKYCLICRVFVMEENKRKRDQQRKNRNRRK